MGTAPDIVRPPIATSISLVIPAFGAPEQLHCCLMSLVEHLPPTADVCVADDCTPGGSIAAVVEEFKDRLPGLRWERREHNVGFVENCNLAAQTAISQGHDLLLLNSDTQVTAGFLEEMCAVLYAHEKHAVVSPRSNNATIFSVPVFERLDPAESFALWNQIKHELPRFHVVPTGCGFCMLVKNSVLRTFGLFDPAYSPGYNEENDFVCRINRAGYSAVAANYAFVFHQESASFEGRKSVLDKRNYATLDARYPEYGRKVADYIRYYFNPIEHFSPVYRRSRKCILYDLSHLPARHCGTSEFALRLLAPLAPLLEENHDLYIGLGEEGKNFFAPELAGYRVFDEMRPSPGVFDLVFKPSQVFHWPQWYKMVRFGARIAYTHQDSIAIRCDHLCGPNTRQLFRVMAESADLGFTISQASKRDFERLYNIDSQFVVVYHGTGVAGVSENLGDYVLLVGNSFPHKALDRAENALEGIRPMVVLGADTDRTLEPGVRRLSSGQLSRSHVTHLYDAARVVVFPSFYEGFGLPVMDAIALGKHVVALDHDVNRELRKLTDSDRLHLVSDFKEMREKVSALMQQSVTPAEIPKQRTWHDVARDYAFALTQLLDRPINADLVRRRWDLMQTLEAYQPFG